MSRVDLEVHSKLCGQIQTRICGHRVLGFPSIKEHVEVVHKGVKVGLYLTDRILKVNVGIKED